MTADRYRLLLLTLLGGGLFFFMNGAIPATDPVESNYVQTAKEMLRSGDYMSPRIFGNYWYDKPAFFYWELIAAFTLFGTTDFAARFFPAVFGVLGLWLAYFFARRLYDARTALWSGLILASSLGYWVIAKTIVTDMTLFVFFNAALVSFYLAYSGENKRLYYLCYIFAGLAALTKGPIGLLLPGLVAVLFIASERNWAEIPRMKPLGFLLFFAIAALWYAPMYAKHGAAFTDTFLGVHNVLRATVSEHPMWDVWWYYAALFFIVFFPWSFVTLPPALYGMIRERAWPRPDRRTRFLLIWAAAIHVFYQLMATKYTTYTLPALLPISILAARFLYHKTRLLRGTLVFAALFLIGVCVFGVVPWTNEKGFCYKDVASFLTAENADGALVMNYHDYSVSCVYYSDLTVYRAEPAGSIAAARPDGKTWNSKNVMPYWPEEDIPRDRPVYLIVRHKWHAAFARAFAPGEWTLLKSFADCRVYKRAPA